MPWKLPDIKNCCGCVNDLKIATAIIAILGIVTSPAVSWALVRHSYMIRVSCFITTSETRPDIVDINFNNILSFGFGANAGLGPSCLVLNETAATRTKPKGNLMALDDSPKPPSSFVIAVKYIGWIVLFVDLIFVFACINLFYTIFKGTDITASIYFIWTACLSVTLSFIYGMLFVTACVSTGGAFPIFEFLFSVIDLSVWIYFLFVVQAYRKKTSRAPPMPGRI